MPYGFCKYIKGIPANILQTTGTWRGSRTIYVDDPQEKYQVLVSDPHAAPKFQLPKPLIKGDRMVSDKEGFKYYYDLILKETQIEMAKGCTRYPNAEGHDSFDECVEQENRQS